MAPIDARSHLGSLAGNTVWTATRHEPNRILEVTDHEVVVATDKSPLGQRVRLEWVQAAFDRLTVGEEVRISSRRSVIEARLLAQRC